MSTALLTFAYLTLALLTPAVLCYVVPCLCAAATQVLQHEIRKTHARNQKVEWVDDLVLMETIGKGGFGVVYKGSWKGSLAAIKVRQEGAGAGGIGR